MQTPSRLQDLGLDAVDPDVSKCRPGDGQNQQHDNRALTTDDQRHDSERYNKKRNPNGHFDDKKTPSSMLKELFCPLGPAAVSVRGGGLITAVSTPLRQQPIRRGIQCGPCLDTTPSTGAA